MEVTLLGTAGWMPTRQRQTTCFASRLDDVLLLVDAGTGLRRLLDEEHRALTEGVREAHLFLSHYHLDHVCGLAYLSGVLPGRRLTVHAAPREVTGLDPAATLASLVRRPYHPVALTDLPDVRVEAVEGLETEVAGRRVRLRPQQHSDVSVAFRVEDDLVVATDTEADPGTAAFAAGAAVLLHEAWYWAADPRLAAVPAGLRAGYASHSEAVAVAGLAREAGVGRLVFVHLNPLFDEAAYADMAAAARERFAAAEVLADGAVVTAGAGV